MIQFFTLPQENLSCHTHSKNLIEQGGKDCKKYILSLNERNREGLKERNREELKERNREELKERGMDNIMNYKFL